MDLMDATAITEMPVDASAILDTLVATSTERKGEKKAVWRGGATMYNKL
jgi:hypothetical protein